MEEGILPHSRARDSTDEQEEERRLCFVGITRAQERLLLTKAAYRTIRGMRERTITSPFLNEMPEEFLRVTDRTLLSTLGDRGDESSASREQAKGLAARFRKGQAVRHPTFGIGRIVEVSDIGQHTRAIVDFNAAGRKTLVLQYARLEPVG
jgi:DNA helicase-2/ATP-dependent DNA helicase PcrA